jgi:hypothetical protein
MEKINGAGDIEIKQIDLIGKYSTTSLVGLYTEIQIFEDIFSPFITGTITITESFDLINKLPLIGEEFLILDLTTPGFEKRIKGRFYVFKCSEKVAIRDKLSAYTLSFISIDAVNDLNIRLNNAWSGFCSDIAFRLIAKDKAGVQTEKPINIEDTINGIKFVCNNWSPVKAINYAAEKSVNKDGISSYLFFENRDGFNFVSLHTLYQGNTIQDFIFDNYERTETNVGDTIRDIEQDYKRIISMSMPDGFDFIDRLSKGMFTSNLTSYDMVTKRFKRQYFSYQEEFNKIPHLNKFPLNSTEVVSAPDSLVYNKIKHTAMHNGFDDVSNSDKFLFRLSALANTQGFKLRVETLGRTDYTVGKVISLKTFRLETVNDKSNDLVDPTYTGKYLISAVKHNVGGNKHTCTLELIKDSLSQGIGELA